MTYLVLPELEDLPPPPPGRVGWPWTEASEPYPAMRADGSNWPSLRVVTPSFGQAEYIEETIRSVLLQGYPRLEYFVIDGGSKDGTVQIVEKYSPWLSGWRSEPDKGQVDAIKKGLEGTNTDYFSWLNSDDFYEPNALKLLGEARRQTAIGGSVTNFFGETVSTRRQNSGLDLPTYTRRWSSSVFHQPGVFWPAPTILKGYLDERLHYTFDVKLLLWSMLLFGPVQCIDHPVARFRLHSESKTVALSKKFKPEMVRVYEEFITDAGELSDVRSLKELRLKSWSTFVSSCVEGSWPNPVLSIIFGMVSRPTFIDREALGALRRILGRRSA